MTRGGLASLIAALLGNMLLAQAAVSGEGPEEQAVVVLRSTVTGNQEQPKVLYIVPWQQADGPGSLYRPLQSLVNQVFEPVERREFVRELSYRDQLSKQPETRQQ